MVMLQSQQMIDHRQQQKVCANRFMTKVKYLFCTLFLLLCTTVSWAQGYEVEPAPESVTKEYLLGKENFIGNPKFIVIDQKYTALSKENAHIRKETYEAFVRMYEAALRDGITLRVTSATRSNVTQRMLWEKKWVKSPYASGIARVRHLLRYTSFPGISRHHWGSEIDLMSTKLRYWASSSGQKTYKWLCENAHRFGFFQPYTKNPDRKGFTEEKWHWSYAPLSDLFQQQYIEKVEESDLGGFSGDEVIAKLDVINSFVLGVERDDKLFYFPANSFGDTFITQVYRREL